jgi:hypothetical protein
MRLTRAVVIFFLAAIALDLSFPELCAADRLDIPVFSSNASRQEVSQSRGTEDEEQIPISRDDDCVCCCAHVVPVSIAPFNPTLTESPQAPFVHVPAVERLSPELFRPPRLL